MKLRFTFILIVLIGITAFGQSKDSATNSIIRSAPGDTLTVSIESKYVGSENLVELDIRASGFDSLAVFEGTIEWDTLGLNFMELKNFGIVNLAKENFGRPVNTNNKLTYTWTEASNSGVSVPDSTVLFTIVFETLGEEDTEAAVIFADKPLDVSAADHKLTDVFVKEENGLVSFISPLTIAAEVTDLTCHNSNDGEITLIPSGASGNYEFLWNNGEETATIQNLSTGDYSFTITDPVTNLTLTQIVNLISPDSIEISFEDQSLESDSLASITANASGGIPPYSFLWSTGDTVETLDGIENGTYGLTITDANNCEASAEIQVDHQMTSSTALLSQEVWSVFPNPTTGRIILTLNIDAQASNYRIVNILGKIVNEGVIQKSSNRVEVSLTGNVPGLYYVNVGEQTIPVLLMK